VSCVPLGSYTPEDPKERERSGRESKRLWYKAPEMLYRTKYYSFETDIWAVGCLFAEMALGVPLFISNSEIDLLFKIYNLTGSPSPE